MEQKDTFAERKFLITMKELIWILSFVGAMLWNYIKFEGRMKELEFKIEEAQKNNVTNALKFEKIDTKLDVIQEGVTNIKIDLNKKQDKPQ